MNKKRNLIQVVVGVLFVFTAQTANASDFCGQSSGDLLAALSGPWSVSHGAGVATAAGFTLPFPAPKDAVIDFEIMPEIGVILATGVDQVGEMLVVAAPSSLEEMASSSIDASLESTGADACDGASLPVLIGTSNYPNFEHVDGDFGPTACQTIALMSYALGSAGVGAMASLVNYISDNNLCQPIENTIESGGMVMKMIVHFSNAEHGSGYLTFDGEVDGASFRAYTPIALSRS